MVRLVQRPLVALRGHIILLRKEYWLHRLRYKIAYCPTGQLTLNFEVLFPTGQESFAPTQLFKLTARFHKA